MDDYLQYAPVAAFYGMKAAGLPSRHNRWGYIDLFAVSCGGDCYHAGWEAYFGRTRPDGSDNSFLLRPYRHSFAGAEFFNREYGGLALVWRGGLHDGGYYRVSADLQ